MERIRNFQQAFVINTMEIIQIKKWYNCFVRWLQVVGEIHTVVGQSGEVIKQVQTLVMHSSTLRTRGCGKDKYCFDTFHFENMTLWRVCIIHVKVVNDGGEATPYRSLTGLRNAELRNGDPYFRSTVITDKL